MTTTHQCRQIILPLNLMSGQLQALRRLHDAGHLIHLACWQQAMLAQRAKLDVSLTALLGNNPHFDRSVDGKLMAQPMALFTTLAVGWVCFKAKEQGSQGILAVA